MWRRPFASHFGFAERLLSNRATEREARGSGSRVSTPAWSSATPSPTQRAGPRRVPTPRCSPDTGGVLRLNGYKFYSTGTLFADVIAVSAVDADGHDVQAIIPADRAGVELFDDWDGFGQRTTASGGTRFTDVEVHPDEVTTVSDGNTSGTAPPSCSCIWQSVAAGIAYAVLDDAVDYVRTQARPAAHSVADSAADRPVRAAGRRGDLGRRGGGRGPGAGRRRRARPPRRPWPATRPGRGRRRGRRGRQAAAVAERLTISAAERLFDTGGASATARALNLDRHWRNARTLASHSPLEYKAYAAGNYASTDSPPANGYF